LPELNPLKTGDVPFPQYSVTTSPFISAGVTITKGKIYTADGAGELVVVTTTLVKGIFQAKATPTVNIPALAGDQVQALNQRSRILVVDNAGGLVAGDEVKTIADTDQVVIGDKSDILHIGRVFEVYTKDAQGTKKKVAGAGDIVIVDMVGL